MEDWRGNNLLLLFLNLGMNRWIVSFTPSPLYPVSPRCLLDKTCLDCRFGGEVKSLASPTESKPS